MDRFFPQIKLTYDDYARMPEGERYELLEGDLQLTPAPSPRHQLVAQRIELALIHHVEGNGLGQVLDAPIDVVLSHTNVVQPDILFIRSDRLGIIGEKYIQGPPDLIVEVLSPSTRERDLVTKRRLYARFGVRELWLVDPDARTIEVCVHTGSDLTTHRMFQNDMRLTSPLLPGLEIELTRVFS